MEQPATPQYSKAPCPVQSPQDDALGTPYGFIYRSGQFSLFTGIIAGIGNKPIAINSHNQILFEHRIFVSEVHGVFQVPKTVYLLFDLNTGATSKVGKNGGNGKAVGIGQDAMSTFAVRFSGVNSKREAFGLAGVVHQAFKKVPNGYMPNNSNTTGFIYGTPSYDRVDPIQDAGKDGRFKELDIALKECPKSKDSGMQYEPNDLQLTGPNESGMVAVSCGRQAVIVDTGTGSVREIPGDGREMFFQVMGIADDGSVVGCVGEVGNFKAFVYRNNKVILLKLVKSMSYSSCATGVSSGGLVVGFDGDQAFTLNLAP